MEAVKVLIFGASGGIGTWAVHYALQNGHQVTAYVRHPEKMREDGGRLTVIQGELTDREKITQALLGQDAVIWCVGIPMKRSYPGMQSLEGHRVLIQAMKEQGVRRLIDWGTPSIRSDQDKASFVTILPGILAKLAFPQAKNEMLQIGALLRTSGLDWTLVRFMAPQNTPYTGNVKVGFGDGGMKFGISREDIGAFMAEQVDSSRFIGLMPIIGSERRRRI